MQISPIMTACVMFILWHLEQLATAGTMVMAQQVQDSRYIIPIVLVAAILLGFMPMTVFKTYVIQQLIG